MPNSLLVTLAESADAMRVKDIARLLRGVESIEIMPGNMTKRLQEALFVLDSLKAIDEGFLMAAVSAGTILGSMPAVSDDAASSVGLTVPEMRAALSPGFAKAAADALRAIRAIKAIAPDLLRLG